MSTKTDTTDTATRKLPAFLEEPKPKSAIEDKSGEKDDTTVKIEKPKAEKPKQEQAPEQTIEEIRENQPERERLLDDASEAMVDRDANYGDASKNFDRIAALWEVVFGHGVTVEQVALCLDLVKTARLINQPNHRDSWVDKIGYSALGGEIATAE